MGRSFTVIFLILASLIATTCVTATTWVVKVGEGGMKFNPNSLNVTLGDTIIFNAVIGPHDVVQSTGPGSCNATDGGFRSPKLFVDDNFAVKTNKLGKIWYYCSVNTHCKQSNMTGVINVMAPSNQQNSPPAQSGSVKESTTSVYLVTLAVLVTSMFMAAMLL